MFEELRSSSGLIIGFVENSWNKYNWLMATRREYNGLTMQISFTVNFFNNFIVLKIIDNEKVERIQAVNK